MGHHISILLTQFRLIQIPDILDHICIPYYIAISLWLTQNWDVEEKKFLLCT